MPTRIWNGVAVLVSMTVLFAEAVLALALWGMIGAAVEHPPAGYGPTAFDLLAVLSPVGAVVGLVATVLIVLPTLSLADWLGRRLPLGDGWWRATATAVLVTAVPAALAYARHSAGLGAAIWGWLAGAAVLASAALAVRSALRRWQPGRTRQLFVRTLAAGLAADALVIAAGATAYLAGWVSPYAPPVMDPRQVVGTYGDGHGGVLRLDLSGTATAARLGGGEPDSAAAEASAPCSGHGTWSLRNGDTAWDQHVDVHILGCTSEWSILGTRPHPKLYYFVDDPDTGEIYAVTKRTAAP